MRTFSASPALRRAVLTVALFLGAMVVSACDQAAELIPGEGTPVPSETAQVTATASATPIVVTPPTGSDGGSATGGRVIPDHDLALSLVQVLVVDDSAGFEQVVRYGTGVVVDMERGLIATAFPVVAPTTPGGNPAYTSIVIATNRVPGTEPQQEYRAEIAAASPHDDLAILRATTTLDGTALEAGVFDVPAVVMGDATNAGSGFSLRLFGFPGLAPGEQGVSQVVNTAQGAITGQRGIVGVTGRTWFKTDARMPFGAAGGAAFDRFGALVGILAQDQYASAGQVGQVRPLDLMQPLLEDAAADRPYQSPLYRTGLMSGSLTAAPTTGIHVGAPAFAENAVESAGGPDLFDYENRFASGLGALYYEYDVTGVADGTTVEERWFLDGILQESLSSSYVWAGGGFDLISDRITAASAAGFPSGIWRLDIFVDNTRYATATAVVGVELSQPAGTYVGVASSATPDGTPASGVFTGSPQMLMFFDLTGMEGARDLDWQVFRDNQPIYTSPVIPWEFGDSGRFWVGYRDGNPLSAGVWEFELRADGRIIAVGSFTLF